MNAASSRLLEENQEEPLEGIDAKSRAEKFRMRRIDYVKRTKRPTQVNGIHRRRRKKIRL
jgi:hypothetical protein